MRRRRLLTYAMLVLAVALALVALAWAWEDARGWALMGAAVLVGAVALGRV